MIELGTSKVCITPEKPLRLSGFAFRSKGYDCVRKDIFVRVMDFCSDGVRVVVIYGDLLWWNSRFAERMRSCLEARSGLLQEQVLFVASHNHSGPGTGDTAIALLETAEPEYLSFLEERILEAVEKAETDREAVELKRSVGQFAGNVYRRMRTAEGICMMPNYEVEPDRHLTVINCRRPDGTLKGRIIHYPCHANLSKDNELHPDYPGYLLELSDRDNPGSVAVFFQGCTADMRPNCVLGEEFRAGTPEDVEAFASAVYHGVKLAEASGETGLGDEMTLNRRQEFLGFERSWGRAELEKWRQDEREEIRQWAEKVLEKGIRDGEVLEVSEWNLGGQRCYFFNAEMAMHYAQKARELCPGSICSGYTNGMIGYLCTDEQIREGGYEPEGSATYFGLAGTYPVGTQGLIERSMEGK